MSFWRRLPIGKEFLFQPLTGRLIIEFQRSVGNADGEEEDADGDKDVGVDGQILMSRGPRHLPVDERIVGDVERIGDVENTEVTVLSVFRFPLSDERRTMLFLAVL